MDQSSVNAFNGFGQVKHLPVSILIHPRYYEIHHEKYTAGSKVGL